MRSFHSLRPLTSLQALTSPGSYSYHLGLRLLFDHFLACDLQTLISSLHFRDKFQ